MIDCTVKDKVLNKIVKDSPELIFQFDSNDSLELFGLHRNIVCSILDYFENNGLINQDKFLGGGIMIEILVPAHDIVSHGGFTAKEDLLTKNIEKLMLEIESLKPSFPDKAEKFATIISGIAAGLGLFISKQS
jgi:hypothetical protein